MMNVKDAMLAFEQGGGKRSRQPVAKPRAIVYVRVSTEEQEQSPEAQERVCREYAARAGVEVAEVVFDLGMSGGADLDRRLKLIEALEAVQQHSANLLLVSKRDRLARSTVRALFVERLVERAGAKVVTADGVAAGDGPEDKLLRTMLDAFAEYERAAIRIRTKAVLRTKKKKGERVGQVPYGFRNEYRHVDAAGNRVPGTVGVLVAVPEEQQVIAVIVQLKAEGWSWAEIVQHLNLNERYQAAARGARWHATSVQRIHRAEIERRQG